MSNWQCKMCPWRIENGQRIYPVNGVLTRGQDFKTQWEGPHHCHETLDDEGFVTLDSHPCRGTPQYIIDKDPDPSMEY